MATGPADPEIPAPPASADWLPAAFNDGWIYRDRIGPRDQGLSPLAFYAGRYPHSDSASWQRRIEAGDVRRGDLPLRPDQLLAVGDRLAWHRAPWWEEAVPLPGSAVLDDGDLCVLDKPSGLPVLPAGGWLEHTLLHLLERRHRDDPAGIPRPVHRLGRFTSGLLVCARQPHSRAWLSALLRDSTMEGAADPPPGGGQAGPDPAPLPLPTAAVAKAVRSGVRKLYRAWLPPGALALMPGESQVITTPIGRCPHPLLGWIWCAAQEGLAATSRLTLLERGAQADLVRVEIGSGRPHQIRIHCAALGAPLLGDPLYRAGGLPDPGALPGQGGYRLQAWRLELRRPDGAWLRCEVPRPLALPA